MNAYPTDEELTRLIEAVEKEPLYAPAHLKEEILKSISKQDLISIGRLRQARMQMFTYSTKIVAGMAVALLLLFIRPPFWPPHLSAGYMDYSAVRDVEASADKLFNQEEWQAPDNNIDRAWRAITGLINDTSDKVNNKIMSITQKFNREELQ